MNYPNWTGSTAGSWTFREVDRRNILNKIKDYVELQGSDFKFILRMNQPNNIYVYLDFILSNPKKSSHKYRNTKVIGLFYEDLFPVDGVRFKQDFILLDEVSEQYIFIIGEGWFEHFPELRQDKFNSLVWDYPKFGGEIASGKHYRNEGGTLFNHHYKDVESLPLEISKRYSRNLRITSILDERIDDSL